MERMAERYFQAQEDLTTLLHSDEERRRAEASDAAQRQTYLTWQWQSDKTLEQAHQVMLELDDMNIIITKQMLSAHFESLYQGILTMPVEMEKLHQELEHFRAQSRKIHQDFGVETTP